MQNKRLYADSSLIIIGIENKHSNSALVLQLIAAGMLEAFISEKTLLEVKNYFERNSSERTAYFALQLVKREFKIIALSEIQEEMRKWEAKIKKKDLEHLASAKHAKLDFIVAFDRDFEPFEEYRTPKQFLRQLGLKPREMEY